MTDADTAVRHARLAMLHAIRPLAEAAAEAVSRADPGSRAYAIAYAETLGEASSRLERSCRWVGAEEPTPASQPRPAPPQRHATGATRR